MRCYLWLWCILKCLCTDNSDMGCYACLERSCGSASSWGGCFWDKLCWYERRWYLAPFGVCTSAGRRNSSLGKLCDPWYRFVIQKGEMRNLYNQLFYKERIRLLPSSQISKIVKLAFLCLQELSSWGLNVVWWVNLWTWRSRGSMWISVALQLAGGCDCSCFSEVLICLLHCEIYLTWTPYHFNS